MNRKIVLTGLAALVLAASAMSASAQARRGSDIYISGDYGGWYGNDGYYGPGVGVSVGFGAPAAGYGAYAAAPCTCGSDYRSVRVAPRYRSSTYAWGGYDYSYATFPYASLGFSWSDNDWRRRDWRDGRSSDRFSGEDRIRISNREARFNDREIRGREEFRDRGRTSRASVSGESRTMTRGGAEIRANPNSEFRSGTNPLDFTVRSGQEARGGRADFGNRRSVTRTSANAESRTMTRGGAEIRGGANTESRNETNPLDFTVRSGGELRSGGGAKTNAGASGQTSGRTGRRGDTR
jgi:hypothetical protein